MNKTIYKNQVVYFIISILAPLVTASSTRFKSFSVTSSERKYSPQFSQTSAGTSLKIMIELPLWSVTVTKPGFVLPTLQKSHFINISIF